MKCIYLVTLPDGDRTYVWQEMSEEQYNAFKAQGGSILKITIRSRRDNFDEAVGVVEGEVLQVPGGYFDTKTLTYRKA